MLLRRREDLFCRDRSQHRRVALQIIQAQPIQFNVTQHRGDAFVRFQAQGKRASQKIARVVQLLARDRLGAQSAQLSDNALDGARQILRVDARVHCPWTGTNARLNAARHVVSQARLITHPRA